MEFCNVCNNEFVRRSGGKSLAKRSVSSRLCNDVITTLETLQQLYNYEVLGLLLY